MITDVKEYCIDCANARTPICNSCTYIENSNGVSTPTQFVGASFSDRIKRHMRLSDLCSLIKDRAKRQEFIPVRWVLEYNKLTESECNDTFDIIDLNEED